MDTQIHTPIIQFGTSRFLQAHVDLFVDEALQLNSAVGPITVVQSSGDAARAQRLAALADPSGYPVRIRGLEQGETVDRLQRIRSVHRTLSTSTDWQAVVDIFCNDASHVISNTGDQGFAVQPKDSERVFDQTMSYPAKLQLLLRERFDRSAKPLCVMPTELIARNGDVLKARVLELAANSEGNYRQWLSESIIWANSLVDRIVSEPIEPAGAVAEPYALWAIEKAPALVPPCEHPAVQMVDELSSIEALKLYILNLGHTWLVAQWKLQGEKPSTVCELLDDMQVMLELQNLYEVEVLPAFAAAGLEEVANSYALTTIERYQNPFLQHYLKDIAQNHQTKVQRRIAGFLDWAIAQGDRTSKPRLQQLVSQEAD